MALSPSPITLADAQARLADWDAALSAASTGSSYSVDGQTLTRQDVPTIRAEIQRWHNTINAIRERSQGRVRSIAAQAVFATPGSGSGGVIVPDGAWTSGQA